MRKLFLLSETHFKIQSGYTLMCDIADEVSNTLGNTYPELIKNNQKVCYKRSKTQNLTLNYFLQFFLGKTFSKK